ncbi:MarR family winged helix-turn-helix transcriptional regulator [Oricola thermophila]|uniref:MarR family transcriptional regulator n=1 Tax=Oricola thermophila TaxID=2742145 RepID=A0A6N1VH94_9HYPH|nr:MarR family transcriptional regulator [Oricola thermophila]QKV20316.1 MarR family transcriptional regulator [Oricola thermophila]
MNRYYIEKDAEEATNLLASLQNTARNSRTHMARRLQSIGLYAGQESILELLAKEDGQALGQLAAALGVKPPTVTKSVTRLQEQEIVERRPSESDARLIHVWLTEKGRALLDNMQDAIRESEARALDGIKKKERKALARILARIDANLSGTATRPKKKRKSGNRKKKPAVE